ncbi:T9SS type A sorting domain-containing protein, partial [bacterium]|nr:T9SS type A sorting domain-containing protein [bacterium]
VWDLGPTGLGANDPSDDKHLRVLILDNEWDQSHPDSAGYAKYDKWNYGDGIYALRDDYATTSALSAYDPSLAASNKGFGRLVFVDYSEAISAPVTGTVVRLTTNKPNTSNDVFSFKTIKPVVEDVTKAKNELDKMTPVPNPYYGKSAYEKAHNEKVIRFVNLPEGNNVTINIFNLAGDLVRTINKPAQPGVRFIDWDGQTKNALNCASGVYVYHIKVDGVGETTGKMICVFRKEFPNEY